MHSFTELRDLTAPASDTNTRTPRRGGTTGTAPARFVARLPVKDKESSRTETVWETMERRKVETETRRRQCNSGMWVPECNRLIQRPSEWEKRYERRTDVERSRSRERLP
jgi:hypothetical protein